MIRVLVVEDSLTVRMRLVEVLSADPDLNVIGQADNGQRAIELCEQLRPDVMTLDMMLPIMNGLAVTEQVMAYMPTPIIIVSSSTNRGELFNTYDALAAGAVEVLDKPSGREPDEVWDKKLVSLVKLVARIKVVTHPRARLGHRRLQAAGSVPIAAPITTAHAATRPHATPRPPAELSPPIATRPPAELGPPIATRPPAAPGPPIATRLGAPTQTRPTSGRHYELLTIGTSTGGPNALVEILSRLPSNFPLPILFVIHVGRPFAAGFAEWLSTQCPIRVFTAINGTPLPRRDEPCVIMAPPDVHLVVRGGALALTGDPERHSCRPSVDVLFESIAREVGSSAVACLLTGMGRDGAEGLRAIQRAGGMTIAQDERTSVVFGMPREAIQLGAANRVLALDEIAGALCELAAVG